MQVRVDIWHLTLNLSYKERGSKVPGTDGAGSDFGASSVSGRTDFAGRCISVMGN
jgi:hypothetical protein